jgi:cellulose synthase/poly-beta-1,6-N-acetylglucosamine synthase-like glycosyltransferase
MNATDKQKTKVGMWIIYAVMWVIFISGLAYFVPSLMTVFGIAFMAFILANFRGLIVFSGMKGDVCELVNMSESMITSAKLQIAALEAKVFMLGGELSSKDERTVQ